METDTPRTDTLHDELWLFSTEEEADEAFAKMRDLARQLELEKARLLDSLESLANLSRNRTATRITLRDRIAEILSQNTNVTDRSRPARPTRDLRPGEPCDHPGCLSHVSHPCESCGRTAGRGYYFVQKRLAEPWAMRASSTATS